MGIFQQFPYSNFHEMNLDMLLKEMQQLRKDWDKFIIDWDSEVSEQVYNWLNEHPEATTTVLDGSLTYKKLVTGTLGFVIPEMFGAVGDGFTDDTAAMQQAFDSGYGVFIPEKEYLIAGTVTISDDLAVFGCGKKSVIKITGKITTDSVQHAIDFSAFTFYVSKLSGNAVEIIAENNVLAQHSVNIHDMYFKMDNTVTSSTATMLYLYGVRESMICNCVFYGDSYSYSDGTTAIMANADATHLTMNIDITSCNFYYIGNAIYMDTAVAYHIYLAGFRINNNTLIGCGYGVRAINFDTPMISNNMIDYCKVPIFTKGSTSIMIDHNYVQTAQAGSCILIENGENNVANDIVTITNNIIHSSDSTTAGSDTVDGITLKGFTSPEIMRHISINDNYIFRVKTSIDLQGCQFVEVNGNTVFYAKTFIDGHNNCAYVNILNNYVQIDVPTFRTGESNTWRYGHNQYGANFTSGTLTGAINYSVAAHSSETYNVTFADAYFLSAPAVSVNFKDYGQSWTDMAIAVTSVTNTGFTVKVINGSDTAHSNVLSWSAVMA